MSRHRRPPGESDYGISDKAMDLWRQCCAILHQGCGEDEEEFRLLAFELRHELGLRPWHPCVFSVGSIAEDGSPPDNPAQLRDWLMVRGIRRRLVAMT